MAQTTKIEWVKLYTGWTETDCEEIVMSDETKISLLGLIQAAM